MAPSERYLSSASVLVSLTGLVMATTLPGALTSGLGTATALDKLRQTFSAKVPDLNQRIAEELADALAPLRELPEDAEPLIVQMIEVGALTPSEVIAARRSPESVCEAMLGRLTEPDHLRSEVKGAFRAVVTPILTRLLNDREVGERLRPAFEQAVLEGLQEISAKLERLIEEAGPSDEERHRLKQAVERLEVERGTTRTLIAGFLKTILEKEVAPDQIEAELFQVARQWDEAVKRISALRASQDLPPRLGELKAKAQASLAQEDVETTWAILSELEAEEDQAFARLEAERAQLDDALDTYRHRRIETKAAKLSLARSRLDLEQCILLSIELVELESAADADRFEQLMVVQNQWYIRGNDRGLGFDLDVAIGLARVAAKRARGSNQLDHVMNNLGITLLAWGEREINTDRLQEGIRTLRSVLRFRAREGDPYAWARTQSNLGGALVALGERTANAGLLQEAVEALHKALEVQTCEDDSQAWAATQINLGNALRALGQQETDTGRLLNAVQAYREALKVRTRENDPRRWSMIQNNLGHTLMILGERENSTPRLQEAVRAYYEALEERPRDQVPFYWATTQHNLCCVLGGLAQLEAGTARCEQAMEACSNALEVRTQKDQPLDWALTQISVATVQLVWAQRLEAHGAMQHLDAAEAACRASLEVLTPQHSTPYHSHAVTLLQHIEVARTRLNSSKWP